MKAKKMSDEMLAAMMVWGDSLNEKRFFRGELVDTSVFVRVTVTRHVGRHLRTTPYEFGNMKDAELCYDWWMKRGGVTAIELTECKVLNHFEVYAHDPMGCPSGYR